MTESSPGQQHLKDALQNPGNVAIEIAAPVMGVIEEGSNWISDKWKSITETFTGVNYDEAATEAYANRNEHISTFAKEFRANNISPETMENMQLLQDAGALDQAGEEGITARICNSYLDRIKEDPETYGLSAEETVKYSNDQQDITVFTSNAM